MTGIVQVLVVEDDRDIREAMCDILISEGYEVAAAENGAEAIKALDRIAKPSLIILDLMMPVMDGKKFMEWKNSSEKFCQVPVIVVSAVAREGDPAGAKSYLKKPIDVDHVLAIAEKTINQSSTGIPDSKT